MGQKLARGLTSPSRMGCRQAAPLDCSEDEADKDSHAAFSPPDGTATISVLTWNVAAVNNNPFEYWISYKDPEYHRLMMGVERFLEEPEEHDVQVKTIFTDVMFQELKTLMQHANIDGLKELEETMWAGGALKLASRRIVTEFIKDHELGSKRLISMPDRVTNTINVVTRRETDYRPPPKCRPSVINNFEGDLSTTEVWWEQWKTFMFHDQMTVKTSHGISVKKPVEMLEPIPRSKYPQVTEAEERLAIPLQILCQAIFDAVVVHFMNLLSPESTWQVVKARICEKLVRQKLPRTAEILSSAYSKVDIMCLQEVAAVFKDTFQDSYLKSTHCLAAPQKLDGKRDQNSMIILNKNTFKPCSVKEVTSLIVGCLQGDLRPADGDLFAVEVERAINEQSFLVVAFHGDTNGLLTLPVLRATHEAVKKYFSNHTVVIGLDANVYEEAAKGRQQFSDFLEHIQKLGLTTCWGDNPDPKQCRTTCSARTSLQPQLNKAVRHVDRVEKSDQNPKDNILFYKHHLEPVPASKMGASRQMNPLKDNTGHLTYLEESIFPTLDFPSDHGILAVVIQHSTCQN